MHDRLIGRWVLLLSALGFGVLAQFYFAKKPEYLLDGVVFYAIAAICMIALVAQSRSQAPQVAPIRQARTRADLLRRGSIASSLILAAVVVLWLAWPRTNYWPIFFAWITATGLYLCGFVHRPQWSWKGFQSNLIQRGWQWGLVALLMILAFLLRAWRVDTIPWTLSGDEGNFGRWAREVLDGSLSNMFITGHLSMPSMYTFWQAAWMRLAGDNMFGLRLPWAVLGTLSVLGTYLLVCRLFNWRFALLVAGLVATYHYHIHYSRLGLNNIADPFFVVWSLYFLVVGLQGKRRWAWATSGVLAGLAFYFYTGGRQVPVILLGICTWAVFIEDGFLDKHRKDLLAMLFGFVVVVGPMALFAVQHPDDFNARINEVGIFQSGWLDREALRLGQGKLQILLDQFKRVFLAFNIYRDRTDFYKPAIPLLDFFPSILFILGLALSIVKFRDRSPDPESLPDSDSQSNLGWRYYVFVIWFFAAIISGGVLTESAPSSQRIISSAVPAMFFVAVALWELGRALIDLLPIPRLLVLLCVSLLAGGLALGSVQYYFGSYQQSWVYGSQNAEVATRIGYYLRDLGPEYKEYFFGAPRMYADFGSSQFIAKGIPFYDVTEPLVKPPAFVDPGYKPVFIFLPERINELDLVRQSYPNGVLEEVHRVDHPDGLLLFIAYRPSF